MSHMTLYCYHQKVYQEAKDTIMLSRIDHLYFQSRSEQLNCHLLYIFLHNDESASQPMYWVKRNAKRRIEYYYHQNYHKDH